VAVRRPAVHERANNGKVNRGGHPRVQGVEAGLLSRVSNNYFSDQYSYYFTLLYDVNKYFSISSVFSDGLNILFLVTEFFIYSLILNIILPRFDLGNPSATTGRRMSWSPSWCAPRVFSVRRAVFTASPPRVLLSPPRCSPRSSPPTSPRGSTNVRYGRNKQL